MGSITFKILGGESLIKKFDSIGAEMTHKIETAIKSGALILQNEAKKKTPYRTGTLRRSIHIETLKKSGSDVEVAVGTDVSYAKSVEFGSGPRIIRPKTKKALFWPGAAHPVRLVHHPGTKAHPYLRPALDDNKEKILQEIRTCMRILLQKGAKR